MKIIDHKFHHRLVESLWCAIRNLHQLWHLTTVKNTVQIFTYIFFYYFCDAKLNFQHHYSSLQCHMTLQKSYWYADLLLIFLIIINDENSCIASYFSRILWWIESSKEQHLFKLIKKSILLSLLILLTPSYEFIIISVFFLWFTNLPVL